MDPAGPPRRAGRPRSAEADTAILAATVDLFVELGFDGMSVEAVAVRAGVGKTTIYRRWPTKEDLVIEAIAHLAPSTQMVDTGNTGDDLRTVIGNAFRFITPTRARGQHQRLGVPGARWRSATPARRRRHASWSSAPASSGDDLRLLLTQQPQDLELVGRLPELVQVRRDLVGQVHAQLVAAVAALAEAVEQPRDAFDDGGGVTDRRLAAVPRQTLLVGDQVPVVTEHARQVPQVLERDVRGHGEQQGAFQQRVVEQAVAELAPALFELDLRRDLVEHLDVGRQACLDGVLGQDPLRERVQRRDGRDVDLLERGAEQLTVRTLELLFERGPDPVAQLRGGLLGERDRRDLAHGHAATHQRHDAVDQRAGLARSGPRLDEQGGVEILGDPAARGLIGEPGHHAGASSSTPGSTRAR